jgi:ureidoacrylate peracid hydrolase
MTETELLTRIEDQLAPEHTALLVIDMQNDFCAKGGYIDKTSKLDLAGCEKVADSINVAVDAARGAGAKIVWIRANYEPQFLANPVKVRHVQRNIQKEVCCAGDSWGYDFFGVKPRDGEFFIEKHRYDAFFGTPLDDILRNHGIKTLVATGVVTNVCVESTVRSGFFRGYYIVVPEECVGAPFPDLHEAALKNMRTYYGTVMTTQELVGHWAKPALRKRA